MVLQIWLWESSTVPDFYLRELKYSHCLSSFFLCVWGEWGGAACCTRRFCCLVVIKVIEINFITFITPIHHHPCSVKSVPSYSDWGQCLAVCYSYFRHHYFMVPYGMYSISSGSHYFMVPYGMYSISSGSPPLAWWESSTAWWDEFSCRWDWYMR